MTDSIHIEWVRGTIEGCVLKSLNPFEDERGWLGEVFRYDELPDELHPVMCYLSTTRPGITRGPHEHTHQTDLFLFCSGSVRLYLWDNRSDSPTYGHRLVVGVGESNPTIGIVPPGVVHAYQNIGDSEAMILNCPNQLYKGAGKKEPIDEIRHEDRKNSPFRLEEEN